MQIYIITYELPSFRNITTNAGDQFVYVVQDPPSCTESKTQERSLRTPVTWGRFHQHFRSSFYTRRSQKLKKDSQVKQLFALSGSAGVKAVHEHVDEIDPSHLVFYGSVISTQYYFKASSIRGLRGFEIPRLNLPDICLPRFDIGVDSITYIES